MNKLYNLIILISMALLLSHAACADKTAISNKFVTVAAIKANNVYVGFDVIASGKTAAAIRFSSNQLITASKCSAAPGKNSISFSGFKAKFGSGLHFSGSDSIRINLYPDDQYPEIKFDLSIQAFDPVKWQKIAGKQPFHFLALYMPNAEVWHQCGWLNETPVADPFPLLLDVHVGSPEISAYKYNRNWSYTVPLGGHPVPVIGLWAPKSSHYVGYEFQSTRLQDNSEKDIATGYCWGDGKAETRKPNPAQFTALVYPHGGKGYQSLEFPKVGSRLKSQFVLLWSLNLPASQDPNRMFYSYIWNQYADLLPPVETRVDLSWIPGNVKMQDFSVPNGDGRIVRGVEANYQVPGSKQIIAWHSYIEDEVTAAKIAGETNIVDAAIKDAETLISLAKRSTIKGDKCVYWEKPLEGRWTDEWGGDPVKSIQNSDTFAAGRLLLSLYKSDGKEEYLPYIDGVMNWAKHIGWTRNEFADVPSSPFAIGSVLSVPFLLDYYMTFRDSSDKQHRDMALQANDLVKTFMCRHMSMWLSDSNRSDNLDSSFLWEPTSGRDWTGAACSNEVSMVLNVLGMAAVHTGDPFLIWALQGSLQRFPLMYKDAYRDSIDDYTSGDFTEAYSLYKGHNLEPGERVSFGAMFRLNMLEPVGSSTIRVLAGEKTAMAFNKNGAHSTIKDYRYTSNGNLSFQLSTDLPSVDLSLTVPFVDISKKSVRVESITQNSALWEPDTQRQPKAFWSVLIKGLKNGDRVIIGDPDPSAPVLTDAAKMLEQFNLIHMISNSPREYNMLTGYSEAEMDWNKLDSWVGAPIGKIWAYNIPFMINTAKSRRMVSHTSTLNKPITNASMIALLYSAGDGSLPSVIFDDGAQRQVDKSLESLAWRAWPPIYTAKLLVSVAPTSGKAVKGVNPGNRDIWGISAIYEKDKPEIISLLKAGAKQWQNLQSKQIDLDKLKAEASELPSGSIAILPPSNSGPFMDIMQQVGLRKKSVILTPNQLVDASFFNAERFPAAIYSAGELYVHTVNSDADGADALVKYVNDGGNLFVVSPGATYPFFSAEGPGFRRGGEELGTKLGMPIDFIFESELPEGMVFELCKDQQIGSFPELVSYPTGDVRLRGIASDKLQEGSVYTPLYKVKGASGKYYGDAAGLIDLPGERGKILFIYGALMGDKENGDKITQSALKYLIDTVMK